MCPAGLAPVAAARATVKEGWQHHKLGDQAAARPCFEAALAIAEREGAEPLLADALGGLAMLEQWSGEPARALALLEREEPLRRRLGDPVALGRCLYTRAVVYWSQSDGQRAMSAVGAAIDLLDRARHRRGLVHALQLAAAILIQLERPRLAFEYADRARELAEALDDPRALNRVAAILADTAVALGRFDDAIAWAERCVETARQLASACDCCGSLLTLGEALTAAGRHEEALAPLEEALAAALGLGARNQRLATIREQLAAAFVGLGRPTEAIPHLEAAATVYEGLGDTRAARKLRGA